MNARNWNKRHILFGMLIMTLGMSKSWMLTANEDFGSAELAQTAPSKSRKDRAKELNRDENKTGQNGKLAAASTSSTPSANLKRLKPKDDFKSDRPAPKTKDDTKSDDSDDSANSKTTVKAKTSSNSKGTVIDVDDPDGIKVILDPPTSSSSQVDSEGKPILVRTFKVVDKNGKTIDTGKTTIKSSNEKMNTFENGQLVAGKDKTITVAVTTIENCNCESIQDVSGFAGELEMFNSITSHIRNQQIAFAKAAIEAAKKKKEEEEKLAKQKEEEDEEKARVDKLVSECKARRSGDEVIDLTKDKKYLYSQSHMSCLRRQFNELEGETAEDNRQEKRAAFSDLADELISQLENAETPREINAAMKNIRRAQRTFRRDDLATDANYLYKAAQTMLSLRNIAAQDLDPQAREYMIKKKLEEFGSYKECAKSPSQPFGCLPSARTQELITEWKGKLNDYKNTLPNANSTTSVAGRTNIGSARAFDWDVNGRLERYNVGVGTRIPQFGTYDRTLPSQTRFGLQNNNTGFGLNNNGLSTNFGNNRFSSFNNQNLINYNQTAYAGGRASLSSIGRIPST